MAGELGIPTAGSGKLNPVAVRLGSSGNTKNGPTLPLGVQAQKTSTATPFFTSKPLPPSFTVVPCATTVSTLLEA